MLAKRIMSGTALDVGCATGCLVRELAGRGFDAYGTDISEEMIARAIATPPEDLITPEERFHVSRDGLIPFDRKFDVVTAIGVFPYHEDPCAFAAHLASHVKAGGVLVASTSNRCSLWVWRAVFRQIFMAWPSCRTPSTVINLLRTGLHSGGDVPRRRTNRDHSSAGFDTLIQKIGLVKVYDLDLFWIASLDKHPLERGTALRILARRFGWVHCGMYRKAATDGG